MGNDAYKRVKSGDPINLSARLYNDTIDTVLKVKRSGIGVLDRGGFRERRGQVEITVRNDTGQTIPRFAVVPLASPALSPLGDGAGTGGFGEAAVSAWLDEPFTWSANDLATTGQNYYHDDRTVWGVANDEIPNGQSGPVVIKGLVPTVVYAHGPNALQMSYVDVPYNQGTAAEPNVGGGTQKYPELHAAGRGKVVYLCETEIADKPKHHWAVIEMGDLRSMRFHARLTEVVDSIGIYSEDGSLQRNWRWRYSWQLHVNRASIGPEGESSNEPWASQWRPPTESGLSRELSHTTQNLSDSGDADTHYALNRYESHLADQYNNATAGVEGFFKEETCQVPGAILENCPPGQAIVPMIRPIPVGAIVNLEGGRDGLGRSIWSFEAMSPIDFERMNVPEEVYG